MNRTAPRRPPQQGIVLATALIILMVMSVLAVSMMRNFGTLERIADNTRDKQRAFAAAQSSLQYAEWWLTQGNAGAGAPCTTTLTSQPFASATARVCSNALVSNAATATSAQLVTVPWKTSTGSDLGVIYAPPGLTTTSATGTSPDNSLFYNDKTRWYVTSLGIDPTGSLQLYQVSAMAYGGSVTTVAVVQSVFALRSTVCDAGALSC